MPYWIFLPKYTETLYMQSTSASSLITGTAGLFFSAIGVLLSGLIISKFKPTVRNLAAWNVLVRAISVFGIISYAYLDCHENTLLTIEFETITSCNSNCHCDYVKYNSVCSQDGKTSFISACHAGCTQQTYLNQSKVYKDCVCIPSEDGFGFAVSENCHVDCFSTFYAFLAVVCLLKFTGTTGRVPNFLVTVRCVQEKDKPVAMGFGLMMMSLCMFVPPPILFGIILNNARLVWGKTCYRNGNCWLYNSETLRYTLHFTAATFVFIGTVFDMGVWCYIKSLNIFDDVEFEFKDI